LGIVGETSVDAPLSQLLQPPLVVSGLEAIGNYHHINDTIIIMSPNFAQFLLDTTDNGNEILAVLEDIVEVTETGGTDL